MREMEAAGPSDLAKGIRIGVMPVRIFLFQLTRDRALRLECQLK